MLLKQKQTKVMLQMPLTPASIKAILNQIESIFSATPTGMIAWYPAANPPVGWIKCDGRRIYLKVIQKIFIYLM